MERKCEQCGEVLFGAVNRCWKCGTDVKVVVASTLPPIRRSPVKLRTRNLGDTQDNSSSGLAQTAGGIGDVIANAKQVLPWFLNADISQVARERCGAISIGLGVLGCLIGLASGWSTVFGIAGVIFGLAGMPAKNRDLATMGLVVSVIAVFLGFAQIAFDIWTNYAGRRMIEDLQDGRYTEY